ncbi:MAG: hypothetical protein OEY38_05950 [Gammaproteobacteria bacterium]|nr:hypothetical protein [Gammaproteobacteria bacterium]
MDFSSKKLIDDFSNETTFHFFIDKQVNEVIDTLPDPEYRAVLEKSNDNYEQLYSNLYVFISASVIEYFVMNIITTNKNNLNSLDKDIIDVLKVLESEKGLIERIDDIAGYLDDTKTIFGYFKKTRNLGKSDASLESILEILEF